MDQVVNADGDYRNDHGINLSADVSMTRKPLDVSQMTLEWVKQTDDTLFGGLDRNERNLLYLVCGPPENSNPQPRFLHVLLYAAFGKGRSYRIGSVPSLRMAR